MPTNNELKKQATELAAGLKLPVDFKGLNNDKLAALVKDLRAKTVDAETATQADGPVVTEPVVTEPVVTEPVVTEPVVTEPVVTEPVVTVVAPGVYVAEGKALTTKRGILGPGEAISPEDLAGGKEAIAAFVKTKHLVKVV